MGQRYVIVQFLLQRNEYDRYILPEMEKYPKRVPVFHKGKNKIHGKNCGANRDLPNTPSTNDHREMENRRSKKRDNYIFEVFDEFISPSERMTVHKIAIKHINNTMKSIAEKLGIKNRITTFVARHTWATILMQNNISIAYISKGLGHTSLLTTEKYLADFDQDKKREVGALISGLGTQHK